MVIGLWVVLSRKAYFVGFVSTWVRRAYWTTKRRKRYISHTESIEDIFNWQETEMEDQLLI